MQVFLFAKLFVLGFNINNEDASRSEVLKALLISSPATMGYVFLIVSALSETDLAVIGTCLLVLSAGLVNVGILNGILNVVKKNVSFITDCSEIVKYDIRTKSLKAVD